MGVFALESSSQAFLAPGAAVRFTAAAPPQAAGPGLKPQRGASGLDRHDLAEEVRRARAQRAGALRGAGKAEMFAANNISDVKDNNTMDAAKAVLAYWRKQPLDPLPDKL